MKRVIKIMDAKDMTIGYGKTEATAIITQTSADALIEMENNTIGKAIPHIKLRVVDAKTGEDCVMGEVGELWAKGVSVMQGYYNMPEETAKVLDADGWLKTGDRVMELEGGHYQFVGRYEDVIVRGGQNIYPQEVEHFMENIAGIKKAIVIGIPDDKYDEQVMAWVEIEEGESLTKEEMQEYFEGKLAQYKIPKHIQIVKSFPSEDKNDLRELAIMALGL